LPLTGLTAMLNRIVPTPVQTFVWTGGVALALIAKTSLSGRVNFTALSQVRPQPLPGQSLSCLHAQPTLVPPRHMRSTQLVPLYCTTSPTSGRVTPSTLRCGSGNPPGTLTPLMVHALCTVSLLRLLLLVSQTMPSEMV